MRILISGGGIAGLSLAHRLIPLGHNVTIVERSPELRGEGYMIDFFGSGYDAAERMGLLPDLQKIHYPISTFSFIDGRGEENFSISYRSFRRLFDNRHFNFMRGDLERVLYSKVKDEMPFLFGRTVDSFEQIDNGTVNVTLSDGTEGEYDLLVGADGLHSRVRELAFGDEKEFSRFLGYYTAAFILEENISHLGKPDSLVTMNEPRRQAAVYPISGDRLATFFVYKSDREITDLSPENALEELRRAYAGLGWIVPELMERAGTADIYFDAVAQIEMASWSAGRVVLVGDACQCVSLLAGQGASMAMAAAYILAEEIGRNASDPARSFGEYQRRVKPAIEDKQKAGRRIAKWFVPDDRLHKWAGDLFMRMIEWPVVWRLIRRSLAPASIIARSDNSA